MYIALFIVSILLMNASLVYKIQLHDIGFSKEIADFKATFPSGILPYYVNLDLISTFEESTKLKSDKTGFSFNI